LPHGKYGTAVRQFRNSCEAIAELHERNFRRTFAELLLPDCGPAGFALFFFATNLNRVVLFLNINKLPEANLSILYCTV
jgi:hypothetical protein